MGLRIRADRIWGGMVGARTGYHTGARSGLHTATRGGACAEELSKVDIAGEEQCARWTMMGEQA